MPYGYLLALPTGFTLRRTQISGPERFLEWVFYRVCLLLVDGIDLDSSLFDKPWGGSLNLQKGKIIMKKLALAVPAIAAVSSFAQTSTNWYDDITFASTGFGDVVAQAAPVAIAVVVAVAGVRVFIKLINRGAGK